MNNAIIRIQQIELVNFKNVKYGKILFPDYNNQSFFNNKSEIIGVYGQNGSGKTAMVDAIWILKHALSGETLPTETIDYISQNSTTSELKFIFTLERGDEKYLLYYNVELSKVDDKKVKISTENLSYKKYIDNEWKSKCGIIEYDCKNIEYIFTPQKNFKLLVDKSSHNHIELGVSKKLSENNMTSFIFSSETEDIIKKCEAFRE